MRNNNNNSNSDNNKLNTFSQNIFNVCFLIVFLFLSFSGGWDVFVLKMKNRQKKSRIAYYKLLSKWKHLDKIVRDLNFVREIKLN